MLALTLFIIPLLGAILNIFIHGKSSKYLTLFFTLLCIIFSFKALNHLPLSSENIEELGFTYNWIQYWGIQLILQIDGVNILFLLLSSIVFFLIVLITLNRSSVYTHFYSLILFMYAGLNLLFLSQDGFSFYFGWELTLIPIYIMNLLRSNELGFKTQVKFYVYTIFGSLIMLLAIIYLGIHNPTNNFNWDGFISMHLSKTEYIFIFIAFALAFAIKVPIIPFHTWQPDTYFNSPTLHTMLLSAVMMKMGIYGFIKWLLPIAGFEAGADIVILLSLFGILYASLLAFAQSNLKRMIAYSSIAHGALIVAGIFTAQEVGLQGAIIQSFNHGLYVLGLFFLVYLFDRSNLTTDFKGHGGLAKIAPNLAIFYFIFLLASVGLPLTSGFVGEFMLLNALFLLSPWYAVIGGLTVIFGAVYMFRAYNKVFFGEQKSEHYTTLKTTSPSQILCLLIICLFIFFIGLFPAYVSDKIQPSIDILSTIIETKKQGFTL